MKRNTLALALCIGLCACSGQKNKDTNRGLGSGDHDAAADADEPLEDGEVWPEEDGSEPEEDGGSGGDSGGGSSDAGSDDAGSNDGGFDASATDAGDGGAGDAGDAGGNDGTKLRVKLPFAGPLNGIPIPGYRPVVIFSNADGGVESVREVDDAGLVVSDTAPAMVSAMLYSRSTGLNEVTEIVTVLAPALGDTIELSVPAPRNVEEQPSDVYLFSASGTPSAAYAIDVYAGAEGCAQGYLGLMPAPTAPARVGKRSDCQLETPGSMLAVVRDIDDGLLRYGGITLPATSTFPASVSIDQWLVPDPLNVSIAGQANTTPQIGLWMRKGLLRVQASYPETATPTEAPYLVPRSLVDSFDAAAILDRTQDGATSLSYPQSHMFQKNRPANAPSIAFDLAERLPGAATITTQTEPVFEPSASWTLESGPTTADAVVAIFSWNWRGGDSVSNTYWYVIGPPETLSVKVPTLPTTGSFALPQFEPDPEEHRFDAVEYYDSDAQNGYRAFLAEPIRSAESQPNSSSLRSTLVRSLPVAGTLRAVRSMTLLP